MDCSGHSARRTCDEAREMTMTRKRSFDDAAEKTVGSKRSQPPSLLDDVASTAVAENADSDSLTPTVELDADLYAIGAATPVLSQEPTTPLAPIIVTTPNAPEKPRTPNAAAAPEKPRICCFGGRAFRARIPAGFPLCGVCACCQDECQVHSE